LGGAVVGLAVPVGLAVELPDALAVGLTEPVGVPVGLAEPVGRGGHVTVGVALALDVVDGLLVASAVVGVPVRTAAAPTTAAAVVLARTADRMVRVR
jgi:hypothetical protein